MLSKYNLNGKTAIVTGACGLLGMQHSAALLEAGAAVVLTDISGEKLTLAKQDLLQKYDVQSVFTSELDVTDKNQVASVASDLEKIGRSPDILINNAAVDPKVDEVSGLGDSSRLEDFDLDQWEQQMKVGLTGAFLCSQAFGSIMAVSGRGGVILNIASDLSVISPDQRLYKMEGLPDNEQPVKPITYSVIKTGLIGLTRYLATYWVKQGVRCNALSPGGVQTNQNEKFVKQLKNLIPMNRMANVDEYRATVQYLCSDASAYMNGQNIVVDGGRSVW